MMKGIVMNSDCGVCAKGILLWRDCPDGNTDCFWATCSDCEYDELDCNETMEGVTYV